MGRPRKTAALPTPASTSEGSISDPPVHNGLLAAIHEALSHDSHDMTHDHDEGPTTKATMKDGDIGAELDLVVGAEEEQDVVDGQGRKKLLTKRSRRMRAGKTVNEREGTENDDDHERSPQSTRGGTLKILEAHMSSDEDEEDDEQEEVADHQAAGAEDQDHETTAGLTMQYFDGQRKRKSTKAHHGKTSSSTATAASSSTGGNQQQQQQEVLANLPSVSGEDLQRALKAVPSTHKAQSERLATWHQGQFFQWHFELQAGFNLLFYGYGSKKALLMKFAQDLLADHYQVVVNGYFPGLTAKSILTAICETALGHRGAYRDIAEQCAYIYQSFQSPQRAVGELYLIVHNIDGPALRSEKAQQVLSLLGATPHVHLLASMDHINAGLLWDSTKISKLNWIYHDVTTYQRYTTETSFESSFIHAQTSGHTRGATYVLKSLTANARGIFRVLVEHQLKQPADSLGLASPHLYTRCREAFLISNDLALRTQLTEFKDHELILSRKGPDGTEYFYSPLDRSALQNLLDNDLSQ